MAFLDRLKDTARTIGDKTSEAIEITKLNAKINSEKNAAGELLGQIGEYYYGKYVAGEVLDSNVAELCAAIDEHNAVISEIRAQIDAIKADNAPAPAQTASVGISCPSCGMVNATGTKFCGGCGAKLEAASRFCTSCGAAVPAGTKFCPECGTKFE